MRDSFDSTAPTGFAAMAEDLRREPLGAVPSEPLVSPETGGAFLTGPCARCGADALLAYVVAVGLSLCASCMVAALEAW